MRERRLALAAGLLIASVAGALRAQSTAEWAQRIDVRARALGRAMRDVQVYEDSVKRNDAALTSIAVGSFRLLVTPQTEAIARKAALLAEGDLRPIYGSSLSRMSNYRIGVSWLTRAQVMSRRADPDPNVLLISGWSRRTGLAARDDSSRHAFALDSSDWRFSGQSAAPRDVGIVEQEIRNRALERLASEYGPHFGAWLESSRLPAERVSPAYWSDVRAGLVTSDASIARRCAQGHRPDCETLLGFRTSPDPVLDWFDAAGRRAVIRRLVASGNPFDEARTQECVMDRQDGACVALLRYVGARGLFNVSYLRLALLNKALAMGGHDAFERLVAARGGPGEKLAAAAGVSRDSLVNAWMTDVHTARRSSTAMTPLIAGGSLFWMLVMAGLGARSSRWR